MDCSLSDSSVHGILQARILEWVAISFSRGSSWPRDWTWVSCIAHRFFTIWATRETPPGSSVHGDSPGKNTGVGCHALLNSITVKKKIIIISLSNSLVHSFLSLIFFLISNHSKEMTLCNSSQKGVKDKVPFLNTTKRGSESKNHINSHWPIFTLLLNEKVHTTEKHKYTSQLEKEHDTCFLQVLHQRKSN